MQIEATWTTFSTFSLYKSPENRSGATSQEPSSTNSQNLQEENLRVSSHLHADSDARCILILRVNEFKLKQKVRELEHDG